MDGRVRIGKSVHADIFIGGNCDGPVRTCGLVQKKIVQCAYRLIHQFRSALFEKIGISATNHPHETRLSKLHVNTRLVRVQEAYAIEANYCLGECYFFLLIIQ